MSDSSETPALTHTDEAGRARIVDVGAKAETARRATATGVITMSRATVDRIRENKIAKGDVLSVARLAGIMAAKRTAELVPLCHPLSLTDISVDLEIDGFGVRATASAATVGRTGVEMEAIVAVSIALVTVYDMAKGIDKTMQISGIELIEKTGGKSDQKEQRKAGSS